MKILKLSLFIILLTVAFISGQYISDRHAFKNKILDLNMEIVITELLLIEHVKHCNTPGYRRFVTLHEHNIDKVYRMTNYALGYPYFLGGDFSAEVSDRFDSNKVNFEVIKADFQNLCGTM
ncbi:hypothetical protein [uncultured Paraglaciecola sp.]|jgi:hypothetical protein|uniref:hypothetical protein n=1 Tax=uncultured Paraglaciecola sp. TaxID=1765024 RepID=UPI0025D4FBA1|nr:hypothetical protein [uncultured Paraglaciecola sp.]